MCTCRLLLQLTPSTFSICTHHSLLVGIWREVVCGPPLQLGDRHVVHGVPCLGALLALLVPAQQAEDDGAVQHGPDEEPGLCQGQPRDGEVRGEAGGFGGGHENEASATEACAERGGGQRPTGTLQRALRHALSMVVQDMHSMQPPKQLLMALSKPPWVSPKKRSSQVAQKNSSFKKMVQMSVIWRKHEQWACAGGARRGSLGTRPGRTMMPVTN